jgi:hypothetical protein
MAPMARQHPSPSDPGAAETGAVRLRRLFLTFAGRLWAGLRALGARLRPPVVRFGPLVLLWLAGAGLILSEFLTYREIVAVTVVPAGGITKGGPHHGYALGVLGLASLPMSFGAVVGRSRPASAAVAVLGGLALAIIGLRDVPSLDDTGLIGRTYDLASANPGAGFWLSVACAATLVIVGLLLVRSRVSAAREESAARHDRRRARRAAETEAPPAGDDGADAGAAHAGSAPAAARAASSRSSRPR